MAVAGFPSSCGTFMFGFVDGRVDMYIDGEWIV